MSEMFSKEVLMAIEKREDRYAGGGGNETAAGGLCTGRRIYYGQRYI